MLLIHNMWTLEWILKWAVYYVLFQLRESNSLFNLIHLYIICFLPEWDLLILDIIWMGWYSIWPSFLASFLWCVFKLHLCYTIYPHAIFFLRLSNVAVCEYSTFSLAIHDFMGTWVISTWELLWLMLLWIFMHTFYVDVRFSVPLSGTLRSRIAGSCVHCMFNYIVAQSMNMGCLFKSLVSLNCVSQLSMLCFVHFFVKITPKFSLISILNPYC